MDEFSVHPDVLAGDGFAYAGGDDREHDRACFFCWGGVVFIGSLDEEGAERFDVIRCRKCRGTGKLYGP